MNNHNLFYEINQNIVKQNEGYLNFRILAQSLYLNFSRQLQNYFLH